MSGAEGQGGASERFALVEDGGWLRGVRRAHSPNQDARPAGAPVDLLVIHGISLPPGQFGGPHVEALFLNRLDPAEDAYFAAIAGLRVSAHVFIRRDGEVVQFVPFTRRAWHAGASRWDGRSACNDFSIGIELEGTDDVPYAAVQYDRLAAVAAALMAAFAGITGERIVGHSEIAPGRKTDPGPGFDWQALRNRLARRPSGQASDAPRAF